jgi:DNA repair exonuclease SbcCD nuclease subunit
MSKITLMRALSKKKTLEKEINDFLDDSSNPGPLFISFKKENDSVVAKTVLSLSEFAKKAQSNKDKIENLIDLQRSLKSAISEANNSIKVNICGKEMTITQAIVYKDQTIGYLERLLRRYRSELLTWKQQKEKSDQLIENNASKTADAIINKSTDSTVDLHANVLKELTATFAKTLTYNVVDPLNVNNIIENLEKEIREFKAEIDFILNEANSNNFIEIDD